MSKSAVQPGKQVRHPPGGAASSTTYDPPLHYKRTEAERTDQLLAWRRNDKAFFAAGACHILAWAFLETYPESGFAPIGLRRVGQAHVGHVYVTDGSWAFDHDGWTAESVLLDTTRWAHSQLDANAVIERMAIGPDLTGFCSTHHSRARSEFPFDPWARAQAYLAQWMVEPIQPPS
jgi:hypothetical protein